VPEQELALFPVHNTFPAVKQVSFKEHVGPLQLVARCVPVADYRRSGCSVLNTDRHSYHAAADVPGDRTLARFKITGVPASAPANATGTPSLKVKVKMDVNGTLGVASAVHLQVSVACECSPSCLSACDQDTIVETPVAADGTGEKQSKVGKTEAKADGKAEDKPVPMETEAASPAPCVALRQWRVSVRGPERCAGMPPRPPRLPRPRRRRRPRPFAPIST
jgi:hypothetical protein